MTAPSQNKKSDFSHQVAKAFRLGPSGYEFDPASTFTASVRPIVDGIKTFELEEITETGTRIHDVLTADSDGTLQYVCTTDSSKDPLHELSNAIFGDGLGHEKVAVANRATFIVHPDGATEHIYHECFKGGDLFVLNESVKQSPDDPVSLNVDDQIRCMYQHLKEIAAPNV